MTPDNFVLNVAPRDPALPLERMSNNLTVPASGRSAVWPENCARGLSWIRQQFPLDARRRAAQPRWRTRPAPTFFTPGIPQWPSRDPLEENWDTGEFNEYVLTLNDPIGYGDFLGLVGFILNGQLNNCLGGAVSNSSRIFLYPDHNLKRDQSFIDAMKKQLDFDCKSVAKMADCKCECNQEKVLIALYKDKDPKNEDKKRKSGRKDPWTDKTFRWGNYPGDDSITDLHAIRADRGCLNNYKQVPHSVQAAEGQANFDKDVNKKLFEGRPLLCCCRKDKNLQITKHPHQ